MNILNKISKKFSFVAIALFVATLVALTGSVSARTQYSPNGNGTSATPVLNEFYDVPNGIGDEADFVKVKPKAADNGAYVDTLNDACKDGSTYNVRTYIHNGASPNYNNDGAGSAVAHDVTVALKAELSAKKSKFKFESTIAASNMAGDTNTAYLNCGNKTVKLSLVASSVQVYSKNIGFTDKSDSTINGAPFKVGSRVANSGDQWACWNDRIIVFYEVKVEEVPVVVPTDAICKLEDGGFVVIDNKKRTVSGTIKAQLTNATVLEYKIEWGDGAVSNKQSDTHSYAEYNKQYTIQAYIKVRLNNGDVKWVDGPSCMTKVEFREGKPPVVVTPPKETPTKLIDTGAGSTFAIFAAVSMIGAVLHRIYTARKATQL